MMKNKMKKTLCAIMTSSLMITNGILSVSAYAADGFPSAVNPNMPEESSEISPEPISEENGEITTELTEDSDTSLNDKISWLRDHERTAGTSETTTTVDYYSDDYYDTDGNATLIKEEKIIYNSEEMQFIAVTTKDGSVFYVLINYSAEGDEDNVYFLNKVDDYDLYALLYQDSEENSEENGNKNPSEAAAQAANRATNGKTGGNAVAATTTATESTEQAEQTQTKASSGMNSMLLLIVGLVVLVGGGFAVFKFTKGKSKKKSNTDDFDGFDNDDEFDDITTGNDDSEDTI
ncbi:MAG: DUF4366 domain-containing protein [Oscillospiraceae bacterium]|nr:DUF4366 domain-containing protein [Oscillospiraceae bacterium]